MRSRAIVKCRERFGYYYERVMEWLHSISYRAMPANVKRNSLTEEYCIYEQYADKPFVRDFLKERTHKAVTNRYGIKIKTITGEETAADEKEKSTIGLVRLMRKKKEIDRATLIIKNNDCNLVYWKFNK